MYKFRTMVQNAEELLKVSAKVNVAMSLDNHKGKVLLVLLGLTLVRGLIYSAVVPPWQAPDEPQHFEYVKLLYEKRRLVGWGDVTPSVEQEIIASMDRHNFWQFGVFTWPATPSPQAQPTAFSQIWGETEHELHQPPLSYLLYLIPLALTATEDTAVQLYAMRIASVFLTMLVVMITFWTTKELFPEDPLLAFFVPAFVVFLPSHTFTTSAVNSDHLAEVFVSILISFWVLSFRRGLSLLRSVGIAVAGISGLLAKRTALVAIPLCGSGICLYLLGRDIRRRFSWKKGFVVVIVSVVIVTIVALGLWSWARTTAEANRIESGLEWLLHSYLFLPSERWPFSLDQDYFGPEALAAYRYYAKTAFETFWARFGWYNIYVDTILYSLVAFCSLLALGGLCLLLARAIRGQNQLTGWQKRVLLFYALTVLLAVCIGVGARIRYWDIESFGAPHGRYLYPVILPVATLFILGLQELVAVRYRQLWLGGWLCGMILFDVVCLVKYIVPFYYG
jgi:hypothetical protein